MELRRAREIVELHKVQCVANGYPEVAQAIDTLLSMLHKSAAVWESRHKEMVNRNALLRQRHDLPVDRVSAHNELARLQRENAELLERMTVTADRVAEAAELFMNQTMLDGISPEKAMEAALEVALGLKSPTFNLQDVYIRSEMGKIIFNSSAGVEDKNH